MLLLFDFLAFRFLEMVLIGAASSTAASTPAFVFGILLFLGVFVEAFEATNIAVILGFARLVRRFAVVLVSQYEPALL